jgi:hypothetical protein
MQIKLYQFSLPYVKERLYLYSLRNISPRLSDAFYYQDHGGIPHEVYAELASNGEIEEITQLSEVPHKYWNTIPYGDIWLEGFEFTIQQFFFPQKYAVGF